MKDEILTPFEQDVQKGKRINMNGRNVPYYCFQLPCHKRDLGLWVRGIKITRGFKVSDYKKYYGIKGRNSEDVYNNFMQIFNKYMTK